MIWDATVIEKQKWVVANQRQSARVTSIVYFAALETTTGWLNVGDAPPEWEGQNPPLPDADTPVVRNTDHPHGYTPHERLELSKEDLLQRQIEKIKRDIQDLLWERDHPAEAVVKKQAKNDEREAAKTTPEYEWFETMNAIGGAWLKATTGPPDGEDKLQVLLVRDGTVVDVVVTTVKRYCQWQTPQYRGGAKGGAGSWGIESTGLCSSHAAFKDTMKIGDCVMLQIEPQDPPSSTVDSAANIARPIAAGAESSSD